VSIVLADLDGDELVDVLLRMIRSDRVSELTSTIDTYEDPITMGTTFGSVAKRLYREYQDVTHMLVAGDMGLAYCLRKAALESDKDTIRELKKLGHGIAFNTAVNCWPGWADTGIVIEDAHISAGIEIATTCLRLARELALTGREQGGAHWLIGALELAAGRFVLARVAFEQAEQVYRADEAALPYALMARGYMALARKADPQFRVEGRDTLHIALDRLRLEGSKDALFFADQIATAERLCSKIVQSGGSSKTIRWAKRDDVRSGLCGD